METSKFKWLEALDSEMLLAAIKPMTTEEKTELITETLFSAELNETGLNNVIVVYSQVALELATRIVTLTKENAKLKMELGTN